MSLIDESYFVGDLNIPNTDNQGTLERVSWYINKYEPDVLVKLMGYPMYKAFVAGLAVVAPTTPPIRMIELLYGKEYTNQRGVEKYWKGIIKTSNPVFSMLGGYTYRKPEYLIAGESIGFPAGVSEITFDGTMGTNDWRGWTPIIMRSGVMIPDVDYSFDPETGDFELLADGDVTSIGELFFVQFELRTSDNRPDLNTHGNESLIADYVYYWYVRMLATQSTGFGEVQQNAENAVNQSPNQKMARAWNDLSEWAYEFIDFMEANTETYPEWSWQARCDARKEFAFMNPIF